MQEFLYSLAVPWSDDTVGPINQYRIRDSMSATISTRPWRSRHFPQMIRMNLRSKSPVPPFLVALAALLPAGCAVGPNFKSPAAPDVKDYTADALRTTAATPNVSGGEAQRF